MALECLRKLKVENWVLLTLQKILIDLGTGNLKHLHPIDEVEHLLLFLCFILMGGIDSMTGFVIHDVHSASFEPLGAVDRVIHRCFDG